MPLYQITLTQPQREWLTTEMEIICGLGTGKPLAGKHVDQDTKSILANELWVKLGKALKLA